MLELVIAALGVDRDRDGPKRAPPGGDGGHVLQRRLRARLEIVWFRVLRYVLGGTRGMFSVVLTFVLHGLFVGAAIAYRVPRRRAAEGLMAALVMSGASAAGLAPLFDVEGLVARGLDGRVPFTLWLCVLPSIAFGATFPLVTRSRSTTPSVSVAT